MPKLHHRHVIHFSWISVVLIFFVSWLSFEFTVGDIKGRENLVKKVYFALARALPIRSAVHLNVPYHHQEHRLSCEVASLLMVLNYRGVKVTETELIRQLPVSDPGPRHRDNVWGDPNLGFVGNINGFMPDVGYGVYEQPIYDLANRYRPARVMTDGSINQLIVELNEGNPIVAWIVVGPDRDISWKTPEGKVIDAKFGEHVQVVIGYTGQSISPELLILLDPAYGEVRLPVKDFLRNWEVMGKRAVVVYWRGWG